MNKKLIILLTTALLTALLFISCESTKQSTPASFTAEQKLVAGIWTETNRDGDIETGVWGEDGSIYVEVVSQDGKLVEADTGNYCFENNQIKLTILTSKGDWSNWQFQKLDEPIVMYYNYKVTKDSLHLERTKRIFFGEVQSFDAPYPEDNYTRK